MSKGSIGFTCSCFDLLHAGHILMLKDAKEQCDYLIVGLQTDPTLDRPEKNKPIQSLKERKIQLEAVKYVDEVIKYETENELYELLKVLRPNVRILGSDYEGKYFTGEELCIPIYYHKRDHEYSSSNIRKEIEKRWASKFAGKIGKLKKWADKPFKIDHPK